MYEAVIAGQKPDLVIHAHVHKGVKKAELAGVPIYNVSLPVWGEIPVITLRKVQTLESYFG